MKVSSHRLGPAVARGIAVLCATVFASGLHTAHAGMNVWTSHGPGEVDVVTVDALVIDPATPATLYAVAGGVFKTTDAAGSWSAASAGLPGPVTALAIDPFTPDTLFAGAYNGVFKSTDGGGMWSAANTGLPTFPDLNHLTIVSALVIDPTTPGTLYVAVHYGPCRSPEFASTSSLIFGCPSGGVFKSVDGGNTWQAANAGLPPTTAGIALALDPVTPGRLYAGTDSGVFKSIDAGRSWNPVDFPGVPTFDPTTPGTLYAQGGLFRSTDGGDTWDTAGAGLPGSPVNAFAIDPTTTPGTLYIATGSGCDGCAGGVFKSTDRGSTWAGVNVGLPGGRRSFWVTALVLDPTAPGTLYAGAGNGGTSPLPSGGVYKSTDGGGSWAAVDVGLPSNTYGAAVGALALDPVTPGRLYAGTDSGVYKSTDGARSTIRSWHRVDFPGVPIFDRTTPGTLYALRDGVFKSTDDGESWQALTGGWPDGSGVGTVALDPTTSGTLYAATTFGVYKSTNGGGTWSAANMGLPDNSEIDTVTIDSAIPITLYALLAASCDRGGVCIGGGVFKSVDGAATWSAAGLPATAVATLAIDPSTHGTLYAGTGTGVFKSTDGAATWGVADSGLSGAAIHALAIDPATPTTLYAASLFCAGDACAVAFKSADGAASWQRLPDIDVNAFAVDPGTPSTLYAATRNGVFSLQRAVCSGDCSGSDRVAISDLITLVNMALGDAQAACPNGVPSGADVTVALIIQAVNNALNGCEAG
jgi:photosystem II stability/assembly factor-like uncharacterized protein